MFSLSIYMVKKYIEFSYVLDSVISIAMNSTDLLKFSLKKKDYLLLALNLNEYSLIQWGRV